MISFIKKLGAKIELKGRTISVKETNTKSMKITHEVIFDRIELGTYMIAGALLAKNNLFIDVRDIREIQKSGRILGAKHVPRCMLEFWIDPESPYHKQFFNHDYHFIFYCAADWRSALATLSANEIGLLNTSHLVGGFNKWVEKKGPIEEPR